MHEPTFDADRLGDIDIARVETARYRLPLTGPWHSAHGARQQREGWLLRLTSRTGATGLGECAPLPEAGTESLAVAAATWRTLLPRLVGRRADTVLATLQRLAATPAVRCALEAAVLDLAAATAGRPLAHCLNPATATVVRVNAALGGLDAGVPKRAVRAVAEGYRVLKLKLGLSPLGTEIAALRELSSRLPDRVVLRLDANRAWDDATAVQAVEALAGLPVEALEEPLRVPHPTALRQLQDRAPWPLALDESLSRWDLEPLLKDPPVRRIVLKPMVTGGPLAVLGAAARARRAGLEVIVTTTLDAAVGTWVALHTAAALGGDATHGLATSSWLSEDVGLPPAVEQARIRVGSNAGLGITLSAAIEFEEVTGV